MNFIASATRNKGLKMNIHQPMTHFVIWELQGVRYLCERETEGSYFLKTIKRI
jgi:hypothetical protein